ncbi:MAG TPA: hypothetical protein VMV77_09315 [Bacteroidales bacterium]|nr:hypothetical protein [Bacteroidales bacterium]
MGRNLQTFDDFREIPNAFMASGTGGDGHDGNGNYIDCTLPATASNEKRACSGISAKSTSDASGLAQLKVKLTGGNRVGTLSLAIGIIHVLNIAKIYPSDANGVYIHF